jgi:DNA-binding NtrC family response regulator
MKTLKIIIIEDEKILRISLADDLREAGYDVQDYHNPNSALEVIQRDSVDVVITDVKMPHMDGIKLLSKIKTIKPNTTVIVMTAYGSVNSAVEAMKKGAYDYITKPFQMDEMLLILDRIKEMCSIKQENLQLRSHFQSQYNLEAFVGNGEHVRQVRELVKTIAQTPTTVLITGETGTGKELLANIIHYNSDRINKPFIKAGCAIFSRDIFESELFGHKKGSFTSAVKDRIGRFEMADGGSIYLDDVDDIPLDLQVKLLRVLQEQEFEHVGGNKTIRVNVRTIASTKSDLKTLAKEGKFREDLFYRLNVFPIHLLPLRERKEDIPQLVNYYVQQIAPEIKIEIRPKVMECLMHYHWPGNVRELKNVVERLLLISRGQDIDVSKVPLEILQPDTVIPEVCVGQKPLDEMMADIEENVIQQALQRTRGHQAHAAKLLGVPPSTLRTKMLKYGLKVEK